MSTTSVTSLILTSPPPIIEHPACVYLASLSPGSEPTMRHSLNLIAQTLTDGQADHLTFNWAALRYKHTAAMRAALIKNYEPATVNKMLCALRRVLKEAMLLELISPIDYAQAINISSIKATKELRGRILTQDEINRIMKVCISDRTPSGYRDAALIAILRGAGLRRAEVVNLNLADFKPDGELKIIAAKGRIDRTVYLPSAAIPIVQNWIELRTHAPGSLLCQVNKAGRVVLQKLSPQAVLLILQKRGLQAELEPFSPHDLRRTFASNLLGAGIDVFTVSKLMGHTNPAQTILYDYRSEETKRCAVNVLAISETSGF